MTQDERWLIQYNAEDLKEERIELFKQLLVLGEKYKETRELHAFQILEKA